MNENVRQNFTPEEKSFRAREIFGPLDKTAPLPPTEESEFAAWLVEHRFKGRVRHNSKSGWWLHDGVRWVSLDPTLVTECLRLSVSDLHDQARKRKLSSDEKKSLRTLSSRNRIRSAVELAKGQVFVDPSDFDKHPQFLNVLNGYVDLRTGELFPHEPELLFSQVAGARYEPGSTHPDITAALDALHPEERDWLQLRLGAALFGHITADDVIVFLQGGGSNGKTTLIEALRVAVGDYLVMLPEKTLMAGKYDHSTELMPLKGCRIAILEELPEGQDLPVKRVKTLAGTQAITARGMRQDNETFAATHTLLVTLNKLPRVREADDGTWRRLVALNFPFHYVDEENRQGPNDRVGDLNLRRRIQDNESGQAEAFLAWLIEGAVLYSKRSQTLPPMTERIRRATDEWRQGEDTLLGFFSSEVQVEAGRHIASTDLYTAYERFVRDNGGEPLSSSDFMRGFKIHPRLEKYRSQYGRLRLGAEGRSYADGLLAHTEAAQYSMWKHIRFTNERSSHTPSMDY